MSTSNFSQWETEEHIDEVDGNRAMREYRETQEFQQELLESVYQRQSLQDITKSWSRATSYYEREWSEENLALGQCVVTAMVVQDRLGGDIVRAKYNRGRYHYWNILPNGEIIDLTRIQFQELEKAGRFKIHSALLVERKKIKDPSTLERYAILKRNIEENNKKLKEKERSGGHEV